MWLINGPRKNKFYVWGWGKDAKGRETETLRKEKNMIRNCYSNSLSLFSYLCLCLVQLITPVSITHFIIPHDTERYLQSAKRMYLMMLWNLLVWWWSLYELPWHKLNIENINRKFKLQSKRQITFGLKEKPKMKKNTEENKTIEC